MKRFVLFVLVVFCCCLVTTSEDWQQVTSWDLGCSPNGLCSCSQVLYKGSETGDYQVRTLVVAHPKSKPRKEGSPITVESILVMSMQFSYLDDLVYARQSELRQLGAMAVNYSVGWNQLFNMLDAELGHKSGLINDVYCERVDSSYIAVIFTPKQTSECVFAEIMEGEDK